MDDTDEVRLSDAVRLALTSAKALDRAVFSALFNLDALLARTVAGAREPMLAQLRLAWWRDNLVPAGEAPPPRDPTLRILQGEFAAEVPALKGLVDGWEALLLDTTDPSQGVAEVARGRAAAFAALGRVRAWPVDAADLALASRQWTFAQFACEADFAAGRGELLAQARADATGRAALPRVLRPLAVLAGLSARAIRRGGEPLLGDRLSPFVAARIALSGR